MFAHLMYLAVVVDRVPVVWSRDHQALCSIPNRLIPGIKPFFLTHKARERDRWIIAR